MNKIIPFYVLIFFSYISLSCFCDRPALSVELVKNSDIIFEGKIIKVDTLSENEYDLNITFKVLELYKGKLCKTVAIKTSDGSCGIRDGLEKELESRTFLIYAKLENNAYVYDYCTNRVLEKKGHQDFYVKYKPKNESKIKAQKHKKEYLNEIKVLKSLNKKSSAH